jgi:hypothetical protein
VQESDPPIIKSILADDMDDFNAFLETLSLGGLEEMSSNVEKHKKSVMNDTAIRSYAALHPKCKELED